MDYGKPKCLSSFFFFVASSNDFDDWESILLFLLLRDHNVLDGFCLVMDLLKKLRETDCDPHDLVDEYEKTITRTPTSRKRTPSRRGLEMAASKLRFFCFCFV